MSDEPVVVEGRIRIPYRWPAGRTGGRFLSLLRDEARLVGLRCPKCGRVAVPPRPRCLACRVACEEWVPVGPDGVVTAWTRRDGTVFALVKLDGADTAMLHVLVDCPSPRSGLRVRAMFAEKRAGDVRDITGFAPKDER